MVEKKKVLIVDDCEINICLLCEMLNDYGIETYTALNGEEALNKINGTPPDMVISDFMMPGMDGLELLSKIKNDNQYSDLPFIILSANADENIRKKALKLGAFAYLNKPLNYKMLEETIISKI